MPAPAKPVRPTLTTLSAGSPPRITRFRPDTLIDCC